ncbi:MAG: IS1595 family transposase [Planctomycetales bacterium]|nr:IS1595 family transposase [Planctomycetales bacterium]
MKYVPPKFTKLSDMAAIDVGRLTESDARAILEAIRWPDGPICPHCGSKGVTRLQAKSRKIRDGVIQCNGCRGQFTVTIGTVMERSHITLRQWVQAFHSICSHKKGVSALQLQRNLGLHTYRAAWFLAHRIRLAMKLDPLASKLNGIVEVDETYVGGKPRKGKCDQSGDLIVNKRGRGTKRVPVVALVERDGRIRTRVVEHVNADNLKTAIRENVNPQAAIQTDELNLYKGIGQEFAGGHQTVNHSIGEYARGDVNTNTAESFFALLKRGVHGTFHHISKTHLHRYCDEFSFRWDERKVTDGQRTVEAIKGAEGKRLLYRGGVA